MAYTPPSGTGNVTTATGTTGNTLTVNKPANLADGDLLILVPYKQTGPTTFTTPTGFTLIYKAVATSTRGLVAYARPITSAAGESSTYSVTASDSTSRWGITAFRLPGMASSYLDAAPTSDVYVTSTTTITDPGVTAVSSSTLALALNFSNNSTAVYQTFTLSGWTNLVNLQITSGSSTSVLDVEYKELSASGATGSPAFTMSPSAASAGGFLFTLALQPQNFSSSPALSGSGTLTASGSVPGSSAPALSGSGSLSAGTGVPALTASVGLSGSGLLQSAGTKGGTDLDRWLAQSGPKWCAHRDGFYATYGEFTVAGFQALTAYNPKVAWNIDVFKTSDGEWVASHDQTTGRVLSGTSLDIPTNTWASISGKTTLVGGNPVARLDDIVAVAPAGTIFFIDNKQNSNTTAFFAKLAALSLGPGNVVNKNFIQSTGMLTAAKNAGYTTWAYAFDGSAGDLVTNAASYDWAGFDYTGTQANWNTAISTGKPSFAHILATTANKTSADTLANTAGGSNFGYMVSAVSAVIPPASAPSLTGSGSLTVVVTPSTGQAVGLTGSGSLAASGTLGMAAAATFSGGGLLTVSSGSNYQGGATLSGVGSLAVAAGPIGVVISVPLSGQGSLTADATGGSTQAVSLGGMGTLTTASLIAAVQSVELGGGGQLAVSGQAFGAPRDITVSTSLRSRRWTGRVIQR
jgi:hypothetical protein